MMTPRQPTTANRAASVFLTAEWRYLAMLNYEIDPVILQPFVPAGTELDQWRGRTFISVVGFLFLNTRVMGVSIPFHLNFEEVNLRFYVQRDVGGERRRGVVFIRELVPRRAIAWTANFVYGEQYSAVPMRHVIDKSPEGEVRRTEYAWRFAGREDRLTVSVSGAPREIGEGSQEEFITEHYWGYARQRNDFTVEYEVEHPRWRVWTATDASLDSDVTTLYGEQFADVLGGRPASAFLADGSDVAVRQGVSLSPEF